MEAISTQANLPPAPSTDSAMTRQQPTYTTVGSVYNPHATTPLQAPPRRPRTRRFTPTVQSPPGEQTFGFPRALLSALSEADQTPNSPTPSTHKAKPVPQYSPLQQNYDRAISPLTIDEREELVRRRMPVPSIRSGNLPLPSALAITYGDKHGNVNIEEDNDSVSSEDTLPSSVFTTKGLTNLASYPNPMQNAAKKKLARARDPKFAVTRSDTPSSFSYVSSDFGNDRVNATFGTVPTATGTPQPLTAGPPGHRQFRGFESTLKALHVNRDSPPVPSHALAGEAHSQSTFVPFDNASNGNPTGYFSQAAYPTDNVPIPRRSPNPFSDNSMAISTVRPCNDLSDSEECKTKIYDTLPVEIAGKYYPRGLPSSYKGHNVSLDADWQSKYPLPDSGFPRHSRQTSEQQTVKTNQQFYAGTQGLIKDMSQVQRDYDHRCFQKQFGVIGGEREVAKGAGKIKPRFLTLEEVNNMEESAHAEPLLNMAYATLLRYKEAREGNDSVEQGWAPNFAQADPAWIDNTPEGNKSFFSQGKTDRSRRRRAATRPRRGY
ncbi:hypothetical protein B0H66DRAFT_572896 [Apodospora peruviana]|uniref:Uncharacterized protein n=1 Tax=Apodospora peruviana TaxID=516989 RepID=A0AAE0IV19_9PEZI|nr:hypothetical protein B0H66DRAFT_572896 [Apodospora peruviana]